MVLSNAKGRWELRVMPDFESQLVRTGLRRIRKDFSRQGSARMRCAGTRNAMKEQRPSGCV
jgi:hypothetical protein